MIIINKRRGHHELLWKYMEMCAGNYIFDIFSGGKTTNWKDWKLQLKGW